MLSASKAFYLPLTRTPRAPGPRGQGRRVAREEASPGRGACYLFLPFSLLPAKSQEPSQSAPHFVDFAVL